MSLWWPPVSPHLPANKPRFISSMWPAQGHGAGVQRLAWKHVQSGLDPMGVPGLSCQVTSNGFRKASKGSSTGAHCVLGGHRSLRASWARALHPLSLSPCHSSKCQSKKKWVPVDGYGQSYVNPTIDLTRMRAKMGQVTWASEPGIVAQA